MAPPVSGAALRGWALVSMPTRLPHVRVLECVQHWMVRPGGSELRAARYAVFTAAGRPSWACQASWPLHGSTSGFSLVQIADRCGPMSYGH
eukprot:15469034-Alexandrium_andersonii.AAC.1